MQAESANIQITVNGETRSVPAGQPLQGLIEALGLTDRRIAVEVNEQLVPRSELPERVVAPGDRVEIVHAIGGG